MGQKIGLHKDGESLGLPPFEAEMRRRIWWQIIMLDTVYALMSGLGQSLLPRNWNTRAPHNVNDSDLFPGMTSIQPKDGPTDMIFCLMQYEISKFLVLQGPSLEIVVFHNELVSADSPYAVELTKARQHVDELEETLTDILDKYCDVSMGPVHELALEMRPTWIAKLRELIEPPRNHPGWGPEIQTLKDLLFIMAVSGGEHSLHMYRITMKRGQFMWFSKL